MCSGFKETSIGPVPDYWEVVRLGDLFEPVHIKMRDYKAKGTEIPLLSMTRSQGLILQSEKFDKRVASRDIGNYKVVKQGQLVYGFPIDEGVIAILHRYSIGLVSPAYHVWQPVREIDPIFMDFFLKTPPLINLYKMFSSNVVERRRNLSARDFVKIEVPLPPLSEQRAIAHVLSTVRQAIEATERVIAAARELKRSLMKYLFTYGPVPVDQADQVPLKETEIGELPEEWNVVNIGDVVTETQYGLNDRAEASGTYPVLRMNNLINGTVDTKDLKFVNLDNKNFQKYRLEKGDILFNRTNSYELVGKTALFDLPGDFVFASYLIKVGTDRNRLQPEFLNHYLNSETAQNRLRALATRGVSQSNISATKLRSLAIPLPSLETQKNLTEVLFAIDTKLGVETKYKTSLEILFQSLLHHLLTGKIRIQN